MQKLAIISTHPIQYYAPWFKLLAEREHLQLKVFYTWSQAAHTVKDRTFGRDITWDIPLLEGYAYEFIENVSKKPGSHHFFGIDNPQLITAINAFNPDAVLVIGWSFKSHLKALRYFKGKIPVWFRGDSTLLDEIPGFKTTLRRVVLKRIYSYVDKAFYVGQANKSYFLKHGLKEEQLVYASHAIDNERFFDTIQKNYDIKADVWKNELGISKEQVTIVFAGKFESKKQPEALIAAVIEANKKRRDPVVLLLIGNGPIEEQLKTRAEDEAHIHFLPFQNQSQMPLVYRLADVFCLPSKGPGETWGLAVNEAMASARPVIVSDKVGCAADVVLHGVNGFIFKYDDKKALVEIIETLQQPQLRAMRIAAYNRAKQFNFTNIVNALENEI